METGEHPLDMAVRHLRKQRMRIERQLQLVRHLSREGRSIDREEAVLGEMQQTFEDMRVHLSEFLRHYGQAG